MSKTTKAKVVFLGDSGVGKTSIVMMQERRFFDPHQIGTMGAMFVVSTIQIANEYVQLQIWDTAGQERFRSMVPMYIRNAKVAFVVYDITNRKSFENVSTWIEDIERWTPDPLEIIILANKCDLAQARQVSKQEGAALAARYNYKFYETSAKNDIEIEGSFVYVAEQILLKNNSRIDYRETLTLQADDIKKKKKDCCKGGNSKSKLNSNN